MDLYSIEHLPTINMIRENDRQIEHAINKLYGGMINFSKEVDIPLKREIAKYGTTKDEIIQKIKEVMEVLNINRLPTRKEIVEVTGNYSLTCLVSKKFHYRELADILGVGVKESETYFGNQEEDFIRDLLIDKGYKVQDMSQNHKYDLLLEDKVRIDVKASHLYHGNAGSFYAFNLEGKYHDCDLHILECISAQTKRIIVIPTVALMGQGQISIGMCKSKWYNYEDRFDYIDKYLEFYNQICNN